MVGWMPVHAHDHSAVERSVGLAVAASVESVTPVGSAGPGRDRADAAHLGERCFGPNAIGVVARGEQHLGGGVETDSEPFEHRWRGRSRQRLQTPRVDLDLLVKVEPARCERVERVQHCSVRIGEIGRRLELGARHDEPMVGE